MYNLRCGMLSMDVRRMVSASMPYVHDMHCMSHSSFLLKEIKH